MSHEKKGYRNKMIYNSQIKTTPTIVLDAFELEL